MSALPACLLAAVLHLLPLLASSLRSRSLGAPAPVSSPPFKPAPTSTAQHATTHNNTQQHVTTHNNNDAKQHLQKPATGVGIGTALLTALYLAAPRDAKDRLTGGFKRGAEK